MMPVSLTNVTTIIKLGEGMTGGEYLGQETNDGSCCSSNILGFGDLSDFCDNESEEEGVPARGIAVGKAGDNDRVEELVRERSL